ncbi:hypothetical protein ANANG_G00234850 [Anguilla anguilla]|uniref:Uncharacterized protein n=1 Tax=Anguilla anguilla TaxID=7936 RepID=A0A9D3LXM1_ANGAN|nr:hypothetical protein ANANG_G00234850 [Anguilla anguilla]
MGQVSVRKRSHGTESCRTVGRFPPDSPSSADVGLDCGVCGGRLHCLFLGLTNNVFTNVSSETGQPSIRIQWKRMKTVCMCMCMLMSSHKQRTDLNVSCVKRIFW